MQIYEYENLSPCPFCGECGMMDVDNGQLDRLQGKISYSPYISCDECGIQISAKTVKDAIKKWNSLRSNYGR